MTLDEVVAEAIEVADTLEFLDMKSKAKDKEKQKLKALKKLRKILNEADLDAFVVV